MTEENAVFETVDDNLTAETVEDAASDPSEIESESLEQDQTKTRGTSGASMN
jgi:hypothetical protein